MNRKILFNLMRPKGYAFVLSGLATIVFFLGIVFCILISIGPKGDWQAGVSLFVLAIAPLTVILLEIAAWVSRRPGPRLALGMLALFVALAGIVSLSAVDPSVWVDSANSTVAPAETCLTMFLLGLPCILVGSLPVLAALVRLPGDIKTAILEEGEQVLAFIHRQGGFATYEELSKHLGISEKEVDRLLVSLIESGRLKGIHKPEYKLFFTDSGLAEKQNRLLALIEAHAQISLGDIVSQLHVPLEIVKEWIYSLVREGKYTGYIHWEEGILYSREAKALHAIGRCPHCGGKLEMAGKGIVQCEYCSTDIFLGALEPTPPPPRKNYKKKSGGGKTSGKTRGE